MSSLETISTLIGEDHAYQGDAGEWTYHVFAHTYEGELTSITGYGTHGGDLSWTVINPRIYELLWGLWNDTPWEAITFTSSGTPQYRESALAPIDPDGQLFYYIWGVAGDEMPMRLCVERHGNLWLLHSHDEHGARCDMYCPEEVTNLVEHLWRQSGATWKLLSLSFDGGLSTSRQTCAQIANIYIEDLL